CDETAPRQDSRSSSDASCVPRRRAHSLPYEYAPRPYPRQARIRISMPGVFRSATCDMAADQLLATPIIDGCIDQVDARIKNGIENISGIVVRNIGTSRGPAQFHCAIAQNRRRETGPAQGSLW